MPEEVDGAGHQVPALPEGVHGPAERVEEEGPHEGDRDHGGDVGEQEQPAQQTASAELAVEQHGREQAERDRADGAEEGVPEGDPQRGPEVGAREHAAVVVEGEDQVGQDVLGARAHVGGGLAHVGPAGREVGGARREGELQGLSIPRVPVAEPAPHVGRGLATAGFVGRERQAGGEGLGPDDVLERDALAAVAHREAQDQRIAVDGGRLEHPFVGDRHGGAQVGEGDGLEADPDVEQHREQHDREDDGERRRQHPVREARFARGQRHASGRHAGPSWGGRGPAEGGHGTGDRALELWGGDPSRSPGRRGAKGQRRLSTSSWIRAAVPSAVSSPSRKRRIASDITRVP